MTDTEEQYVDKYAKYRLPLSTAGIIIGAGLATLPNGDPAATYVGGGIGLLAGLFSPEICEGVAYIADRVRLARLYNKWKGEEKEWYTEGLESAVDDKQKLRT